MADVTDLSLVVGVSALINTISATKTGKDPVITLVASGIMFVGLAVVGGLTKKWELPIAFAWVFLIGSLIGRGIPLLQSVDQLATAPKPK